MSGCNRERSRKNFHSKLENVNNIISTRTVFEYHRACGLRKYRVTFEEELFCTLSNGELCTFLLRSILDW